MKEELIDLKDATVVIRKPDGKIKVKKATNLVDADAVGGTFWGMLIGLLFWAPWLGLVVGASAGTITGTMPDYGICPIMESTMISLKKSELPLNLVVLPSFYLSQSGLKIRHWNKKFNATIIRTSLSNEDEQKLKAAFGAGE